MEAFRKLLQPAAPLPAKVFGWILVFAGAFFAYVYMVDPGSFFPGVSIATYSEQFGLYSTGVRILGSVLGIVVALILDSAALLALMLATRVFIEIGDVFVGLIVNDGSPDANTFALLALATIEIVFVAMLLRRLLAAAKG